MRKISTRGRLEDGAPNPVDVHVGARMRLRRTLLGISQEKLGEAIGLTFQQIQKYERGTNRISASRLFDLARVLDVPISFFFDDMPDAAAASSPSAVITGTAMATSDPVARATRTWPEMAQVAADLMAIDIQTRKTFASMIRLTAEAQASVRQAAE